MKKLDLNVATPEEVPKVLQAAADAFAESALDLQSGWQVKGAGHVWKELSKVLERAANQAQQKVDKYYK
jgi:hypothetical protein